MPTRQVSGTINKPDGTGWAGVTVSFKLDTFSVTADAIYPRETLAVTDEDGSFSVDLTADLPSTWTITFPDRTRKRGIVIQSGDPITLSELISASGIPTPITNDVQTALDAGFAAFADRLEEIANTTVGASAYEIAVLDGFVGTEEEWLASLVGPQGETGDTGPQGETGPQGPPGDGALHVYVPRGWDDAWQEAVADAGTTPARVAFIGDSITEGAQSTDNMTISFAALVGKALVDTHGHGGDAWSTAYAPQFMSSGWDDKNPFTMKPTGMVYTSQIGYSLAPIWSAGAPSEAITFVTPYACTDIDLIHFDAVAGTWSYSVDGGSAVTVTTTGTAYLRKESLTGLANTSHTITFSGGSANAALRLCAVATYKDRTAGVQVHYHGVSGRALCLQNTANLEAWAGRIVSAGSLDAFGFPSAPDLAIIELGINDLVVTSLGSNLFGPERFGADLITFIGWLRRARSCSVLIVAAANPDGIRTDMPAYFGSDPENWPAYKAQMRRVAESLGCAYVDIDGRWGATLLADGMVTAINAHPTDAGHADMATAILEVLT